MRTVFMRQALPGIGLAAKFFPEAEEQKALRLETFEQLLDADLAPAATVYQHLLKVGNSVLARCSEDGLHYLGKRSRHLWYRSLQ